MATIKKLNSHPQVVKKATCYHGGKNATVSAQKSPSRYTGGKNPGIGKVKK